MPGSFIPSGTDLAARLARLKTAQMRDVSERSDVSLKVIWQIKTGRTRNPRIDTACKLWPVLLCLEEKS